MGVRLPPRIQGDIGERAAAAWLLQQGYPVAHPFGHSPDWDLVAEIDGALHRIQVKTSTVFVKRRWDVRLSTSGGNQSWNRVVKLFHPSRCDYVFALVGDGRQWFIPAAELGGSHVVGLGGPKYERFEVCTTCPIADCVAAGRSLDSAS